MISLTAKDSSGGLDRAFRWLTSLLAAFICGDRRIVAATAGENEAVSLSLYRSLGERGVDPQKRIELRPDAKLPARWRKLIAQLPVMFELPPDRVLQRDLQLPAEALRSLGKVVDHNLSQWTPFEAGEVYAVAEAVRPARPGANIRLTVAPRAAVEELTASMQRLGVEADAILLDAQASRPIWLRAEKRRRRHLSTALDLALLGIGGLLIAGISFGQYEYNRAEIAGLKAVLREKIDLSEKAKALEGEIVRIEARQAFLAEQTANRPQPADALSFLAGNLPSDAEIEAIEWAPSQLVVRLSAPGSGEGLLSEWSSRLGAGSLHAAGHRDDGGQLFEWTSQPAEWKPK